MSRTVDTDGNVNFKLHGRHAGRPSRLPAGLGKLVAAQMAAAVAGLDSGILREIARALAVDGGAEAFSQWLRAFCTLTEDERAAVLAAIEEVG